MSQPEKRSNAHLHVRVPPEFRAKIEDYQHTKGMKEISEATIDLIEKGLSTNIEALNLQKCRKRSEIPAHYGKFVRCIDGGRVITEEQCQACRQYELIKLPLITMEKLRKLTSELKQSIQELSKDKTRLEKEVQELESDTRADLFKTIREQEMELRIAQKLLREKTETCTRLETDLSTLREATDLLLRKTTEEEPQAITQKVEPNPPILKRVIEEKKITTEEFAPTPQQPQRLMEKSEAQNAPLLPKIIECPDIGETVNVEETCKKMCQKRGTCQPYEQIIVKKAIAKQ